MAPPSGHESFLRNHPKRLRLGMPTKIRDKRSGVVTLITDFGLQAEYVGAMKGAVLTVNPRCQVVDITNHATTDYYREFLPGMIDPGTVTFTANYVSSSSWANSLINDVMDSRAKVNWKVTLSGTATQHIWFGNGYVTNYQLLTANDQAVQYSISMKVTAKPSGSTDSTGA
jgi:predicted secreted protein